MAGRAPDLAERTRALRPSLGKVLLGGLGPIALVVALALVLQFFAGPALGPFFGKLLLDIGIAIVVGVSLNLVNGFTGQFSIGHAAFMTVGGYTAGLFVYYGHWLFWGSPVRVGGFLGASDLWFLVSILAGGVGASLAGLIVGLPSLRLRGDYLAIVTLGFGEIVRVLVTRTQDVLSDADEIAAVPLWELPTHVGGALGFDGLPFLTNLFFVWLAAGAVLLFSYRLKRSDQGRALLAIREDEIAAEAMGIPTTRLKVQAFVYAAFFAGVAGALFAHEIGTTLNPKELGFQKSFEVVIMVVLGGMGSVSGTTIAAIALTLLPEILRSFSEYRMVVYAVLLIVVMLVRPQGLLGIRELWELPLVRRWLGDPSARPPGGTP